MRAVVLAGLTHVEEREGRAAPDQGIKFRGRYVCGHQQLSHSGCREGRDPAGLWVVAAAAPAAEVYAVDMDLRRGAGGQVVHLVNLVDVGDEQGDLSGLVLGDAVLLQQGVVVLRAVVEAAEAGLGHGVLEHADHAPRAVVVGADVAAGAPDDRGDGEAAGGLVEEVRRRLLVRRAGAHRDAVLLRHGVGVREQPLKVGGRPVEQRGLVRRAVHKLVHVVDEVIEGVGHSCHRSPRRVEVYRDGQSFQRCAGGVNRRRGPGARRVRQARPAPQARACGGRGGWRERAPAPAQRRRC